VVEERRGYFCLGNLVFTGKVVSDGRVWCGGDGGSISAASGCQGVTPCGECVLLPVVAQGQCEKVGGGAEFYVGFE
jgi:hypothetical protein